MTEKFRVLVVDDTPALRQLTALILEDTQFEVVGEAEDGEQAVVQAGRLQPDLVLLDLAMPVMDGLEALPLIREQSPPARIVIVSGFDQQAMERAVRAAGADGYVEKGVSPRELVQALTAIFEEPASLQDQSAASAQTEARTG